MKTMSHPARACVGASCIVAQHRSSTYSNSPHSNPSQACSLKDGEATSNSCSKNSTASDDDCVGINPEAVVAAGPEHTVTVFALEDVVGEALCCHETALAPCFVRIIQLAPVTI